MADAKLGPKMQEWQVEHSNLYLKSNGKEGHVMKRTPPGGYPEMDVYSLMLTTTGRKSGEKDRKSTRLNSSHQHRSRMPSSA